MNMYGRWEIIPIILLATMAVGGYIAYPVLPAEIPSHWGLFDGVPDVYSPKLVAVLMLPIFATGLYILLSFLPYIDPLRKNIESSAKEYYLVKISFIMFLGGLYAAILTAGAGYKGLPICQTVLLSIAFLFGIIAAVLPRIKRNYTLGIRLPWTLQSDAVWDKTHRFGRIIFGGLALIAIIASFLPDELAFAAFISAAMLAVTALFIFAYRAYRAEQHPA